MNITRQQALDMLKKLGRHDLITEADETLPDPIDIDRDATLLAKFGLVPDQLMDRWITTIIPCSGISPRYGVEPIHFAH